MQDTKGWPIKGKKLGLQLAKAHKIAQKHLSKASVRQTVHYNPQNKEQKFNVGDFILIINETRKLGEG